MNQALREALEASHADLNQWFIMHQECLLLANDLLANIAFSRFSQILQWHIDFENNYLLFGELSGRWTSKIYLKEHEKLLSMLHQCQQRLASYCQLSGRYKRLALLELLEEQSRFLHVMSHHEQREEQDLFLHLTDNNEALIQWHSIVKNIAEFDCDKNNLKCFLENDELNH